MVRAVDFVVPLRSYSFLPLLISAFPAHFPYTKDRSSPSSWFLTAVQLKKQLECARDDHGSLAEFLIIRKEFRFVQSCQLENSAWRFCFQPRMDTNLVRNRLCEALISWPWNLFVSISVYSWLMRGFLFAAPCRSPARQAAVNTRDGDAVFESSVE